jgi:hypothetical protein
MLDLCKKRAKNTLRNYIPKTFDGLMVDFSQNAERKSIWQRIALGFRKLLTKDLKEMGEEDIKAELEVDFVGPMREIVDVNKPFAHDICTEDNRLYRKLLD